MENGRFAFLSPLWGVRVKSHTGFRLVPTSMTLNDLESRNSLYFAFFTEFDRFSGRLYHNGWR